LLRLRLLSWFSFSSFFGFVENVPVHLKNESCAGAQVDTGALNKSSPAFHSRQTQVLTIH
jgi:hypothetical protein